MADIRNGNIRESRRIDLDGVRLDEIDSRLDEWAEGLTDCKLTVEHDYEYGDCFVRQYVSGWRPATDEEIRKDQAERAAAAAQQREWQERQAADLRRARPDLFA